MRRSGCEMRTPATVEVPESAFGLRVTLRLVSERGRTGAPRVPLPVALVALATLNLRLGFLTAVGRERLADVIRLLELSCGAASGESLVCSGVDELTLGGRTTSHRAAARIERALQSFGRIFFSRRSRRTASGSRITSRPESVKAQGFEGLVAKRLDSRYEAGLRSGAWQKMRVNRGQEFVIGGYTVGTKTFDALIFGYYESDRLMYAARTRNGFTPVVREQLFKKFRGLEIKDCPFENLPEAKSGRRVRG